MSDPEADRTRLRHMLDASQAALRFTVGKTLADREYLEVEERGLA